MAREVPNPFGTSLIDLLVSGLAMVAMLWVMNATNNGLLGTGDEEATSGLVRLEQFGSVHHMKRVTVTLPGIWSCTYELIWQKGPARSIADLNNCNPEPGHDEPAAENGRISFASQGGTPGILTTVILGLEAPGDSFFSRLTVSVENLVGQNLDVAIEIEPCCSPTQPHYLGLWVYSGAGPRKLQSFWHEAAMLGEVFNIANSPPIDGTRREPWIMDFGDSLASGAADPVRTIFDVPAGVSCNDLQNGHQFPKLELTFESEGDIVVDLPAEQGTSTAFMDLQARFDERMDAYVRWLDQVGP